MTASILDSGLTRDGADIMRRVRQGIGGLDRLGLAPGSVVAVMLRNDTAFFEAILMARLGGHFSCPINWHFKADEAGFILRDCAAAVLILHADLLGEIASAIPEGVTVIVVEPSAELRAAFRIAPGRPPSPPGALDWETWLAQSPPYDGEPRPPLHSMPYSSGTTGRPKGIRRDPVTPAYAAAMAELAQLTLGIAPGMRTAAVAPLYHSAPAAYALYSAMVGDLIVVHPRLDAERLLADIERHRLSHLYLVATHYVRLLRLPDEVKRRYDVSSLQFVASTGSPCPPEVKRAMIAWWGPVIHESYASSETGFITLCTSQDALARPGTAGRLLPGAQARILDEAGRDLPAGEAGLIYCRQPAYPDFTYVNNDAARRSLERDGLICVGDIGYFDADGYLFVCDRRADMVISGGVNIYPAEIEAVLMTMPGVADCAVFGIPDEEFGEKIAAHVLPVAGAGLAREDVAAFLAARIAGFKVPKVIEFASELPREESGKIFKRKLRDPYWQAAGRRI